MGAKERRAIELDAPHSAIIKMLLDSGVALEGRDHNGCTALMIAVANADEPVTRSLMIAKADVNAGDFEGRMVLDYALFGGKGHLADVLRDAGARSRSTALEN